MYAHLNKKSGASHTTKIIQADTGYFLEIFVAARHLDYTENASFLKTIAKHPSDGSKTRDVGHAWIYLEGEINGQRVFVEGGHSGETGRVQARYFDGVMNYIDYGVANPRTFSLTKGQRCREKNPIKYLWQTQYDGFFQRGNGGHKPTFAAKVFISKEQFESILAFISTYNFQCYTLTGGQCSSFVAQVASLAGLELECEVTMEIEPYLDLGKECLHLWEDPTYSLITISSPDILEKSLMESVESGRAEKINFRYTK